MFCCAAKSNYQDIKIDTAFMRVECNLSGNILKLLELNGSMPSVDAYDDFEDSKNP
jgi:hypothetical protein